jgi:HNH endonuclease
MAKPTGFRPRRCTPCNAKHRQATHRANYYKRTGGKPRPPKKHCQNPTCGKPLTRWRKGCKHAALGKDSMKYCNRECYFDHRYGADRPKRSSTALQIATASAKALCTSLRKKCKNLGVPYDPECFRVAVCDRDGWVCQLCGIECLKKWSYLKGTRTPDKRSAEHDHIIPLTASGSPGNVFPNSQCLCNGCNNKKRDTADGQLRLDLEGSVQRWENEARSKRQQNSRCSEAIPAAAV